VKSKKKVFLFLSFVVCSLSLVVPAAQATEIDTSPDAVYKKTLELKDESTATDIYSTPAPGAQPVFLGRTKNIKVPSGGETGPNTDSMKFPKLDREYDYYSTKEFQDRILPEELRGQTQFASPPPLQGEIAHVGCGKSTIGDKDTETRVGKSETKFDVPDSYGKTLMITSFFQSIFVPSKDTNLKFSVKAPSASPQPPDYLTECQNDQNGQSLESTSISNTSPKPLSLFGQLISTIRGLIDNLLNGRGSVATDVKVQQIGYIPAEKQFEDQTVGDNGFLNFFKPEERPFSKEGDQVEKVPYKVLGQSQDAEVGYLGMSSYKSGTIDLVRSLLPEELQSQIGEIVAPPSSKGLTYTLDYRNYNKVPSLDKKNEIIRWVKQNPDWSDSLIELYWDQVVQRSVDAKINPAFTLAIWIEESAASSPKVGTWSPFGCFPSGDTDQRVGFSRSLDCFIKFTANEHPNDFTDWAKYFCGPGVTPICANNQFFLDNLKTWYDRISS